jgi:hypothetical protein
VEVSPFVPGWGGNSHNIPLLIRICTHYDVDSHQQRPMPSWPAGQGRSVINLALKVELIAHLDQMADLYGCSRAAYVRQLIVKDMQRLGPGHAATKA